MTSVFLPVLDASSANTTGGPLLGENASTVKPASWRSLLTSSAVSLSPRFWADTLGCLQSARSCSTNLSLLVSIWWKTSCGDSVITSFGALAMENHQREER